MNYRLTIVYCCSFSNRLHSSKILCILIKRSFKITDTFKFFCIIINSISIQSFLVFASHIV
uniref:Uncharacterized protein n=1 Tax=Podoviridae sp. ctZkC8 TaxID=2825259 RepID=A0A8S5UC48_9CAUD|nr:MAG TPA: hypothetical protein [Podoviridae sp. ctZkC8]